MPSSRPTRGSGNRAAALAVALLCSSVARAASPDAGHDPNDTSIVLVRVVEAQRTAVAADVVFTGDIQAQAQTSVAFRINGKIARRLVEVGDHVAADQVLATLDPQEQQANLDNAKAALVSAEALLTQAKVGFRRQEQLLSSGYTTRPAYDQAEQQLRTTQAAVESAKAQLGTTQEQFSYTELRSGVAGVVLSRSFETGQVVQAGQTVLVLAQDGARDAVFNVYEALPANPPADKTVTVVLQADPRVTATGTVREISPSVDQASGTVRIKIGLADTPPQMALGSVVIGKGRFKAGEAVILPWSALYRWENKPAVWIYDRQSGTVSPRIVTIDRYTFDTIALASGVEPGESVVTAGIQFLRPGQSVAVADAKAEGIAK
ncbi:efflux RND transporter periplasmic adaptor subunit [Methylobacterium gnaphalii]|uniref:Acriflavin resistance protein n=1 Tax=Methylobacterium gnaphalii TaxID=1010610 RepID=A0A512JJ44_9HYPH|nr:efflux RND transporter periplasmic adaptor subunit [Methylobacterium gnaphalii]GEP09943.1 acriflavin resistance protein [Methylobacterium gnaphalii]GJD68282.1 Multidrug resistance protein MdtA [Methylobacterium gnaphalii]GLS51798.1 acriflavin resistance protein [Methylobacterium gnaphalii]